MKILLNLEREKLKQEVIFETTPDDHAIIYEFNLAVVDLQIDKERGQPSPEWKTAKLHYFRALFFNRVVGPHVPRGGWTLTDYSQLDYP